MTAKPTGVFISYSHRDEAWKDRLVSHLRVLEWEGALDVWDDRRIEAGCDWRPAIEEAIARARVAILIVSKEFLTSKFIREHELMRILAGRQEGRLRVIPLIAEPCAWQAVSVLNGIQARPRDGRPLSAGTEHQIDTDLSDLALEVLGRQPNRPNALLNAAVTTAAERPVVGSSTRRPAVTPPAITSTTEAAPTVGGFSRLLRSLVQSPLRVVAPLAASGGVAVALVVGAQSWKVRTQVALDVVTERVSFVVRGTKQTLDPDVRFSRLTFERCASATFEGIDFKLARLASSTLTRFICRDPDARITITSREDAALAPGSLGAMSVDPGTEIGIRVVGDRVPVLTLEISGHPLEVDVPLDHDVEVVADLAEMDPVPETPTLGLVRHVGLLREAPRQAARLQTSDRGAVLVIALDANSVPLRFAGSSRLPVESVQLDRETRSGTATTALLGEGILSYVDYPKMKARPIKKDDGLVLERISDAHVRRLRIERVDASERSDQVLGLKLSIEGILERGEVGVGDSGRPEEPGAGRWDDLRLSVYDVLMYERWQAAGLAGFWVAATLWTAYLGWKKA